MYVHITLELFISFSSVVKYQFGILDEMSKNVLLCTQFTLLT
jgi:hypothetical protein